MNLWKWVSLHWWYELTHTHTHTDMVYKCNVANMNCFFLQDLSWTWWAVDLALVMKCRRGVLYPGHPMPPSPRTLLVSSSAPCASITFSPRSSSVRVVIWSAPVVVRSSPVVPPVGVPSATSGIWLWKKSQAPWCSRASMRLQGAPFYGSTRRRWNTKRSANSDLSSAHVPGRPASGSGPSIKSCLIWSPPTNR